MWYHLWDQDREIVLPRDSAWYQGMLKARSAIQAAEAVVTCDWIDANEPLIEDSLIADEVFARDKQ